MDVRETLTAAFDAALRAVAADEATAAAVPGLELGESAVCLLALGKAAIGMTAGFCRVHAGPVRGLAVADEPGVVPAGVRLMVGDHPLPSQRSLDAGEALLETVASAAPDEAVVVLISGGGSALAEALVPGVGLDDMRLVTRRLLLSGTPIEEINAIRKALSRLKGGGLAGAAPPGVRLVTLAISDVVGDSPEVIASGPTVAVQDAAKGRRADASRFDLPPSIAVAIEQPAEVSRASGDSYTIIASGRDAAAAAASSLRLAGLRPEVVDTALEGDAATRAVEIVTSVPRGTCLVYAGETTVTVTGNGAGGRNQEAALAAAVALDGRSDVAFLAAGTDGIDGTTEAAGAVIDGLTAGTARAAGLDPRACLASNDSGGLFSRMPGQIVTGRTGTNVGDLWVVVRD
jgi:glycerate 2-kinase